MIKIQKKTYCPTFDYLYLFFMVVYMGQMTPETSRMVGSLSGEPVPFLIPIVLTIILLYRHPKTTFPFVLIFHSYLDSDGAAGSYLILVVHSLTRYTILI